MIWLGTFLWLVPLLIFLGMEVNGFRKYADRWPTLSELVKKWEGVYVEPDGYHGDFTEGGIATWSWKRWLVAVALPIVAVVLELHWVFEVF